MFFPNSFPKVILSKNMLSGKINLSYILRAVTEGLPVLFPEYLNNRLTNHPIKSAYLTSCIVH